MVQASPVNGTEYLAIPAIPAIIKPSFPSLEDCRAKFKPPANDKAMYFTGLINRKDINKAKDYAEHHGLVHVGNSYPTGFTNPGNYQGTEDERKTFQKNFSQLYADATTGIAYLMLDYDKTPTANSVFNSVEFPAMKNSAKVDKILQIPFTNPPPDPTKTNKQFWPDDAGAAALDPPPTRRDPGLTNRALPWVWTA